MEEIIKYINPELLVLIPVLYVIGLAIKNSKIFKDEYIPFINGGLGIFLSTLWIIATNPLGNGEQIAMALFTAIVQGILCAGAATYFHQLIKQGNQLKGE